MRICSKLLLVALLAAPALAQEGKSGLDLSNLDTTTSPCKDFYQYANGGWLKKNVIPADKPRWGTFNILADRNQELQRQILEEAARNAASARPGSIDQKLGDFWLTGMDTAALQKAGLAPLKQDLEAILAIKTVPELGKQVISMHRRGMRPFFRFGATQDAKNSSLVIAEVRQGGLGLPERNYYLRDDEKSKTIRQKYKEYIAKVFETLGETPENAKNKANQVFNLELQLAQNSLSNVEMRDPEATYHPVSAADFQKNGTAAGWDWQGYFQAMGAPPIANLNNATPKFVDTFHQVLSQYDIGTLKDYLTWNLFRDSSAALSEDVYLQNFEFYGKTLQGTPAATPRWRRVAKMTDTYLGEALGQKYVERHFPPQARAKVQEMVGNLQAVLAEDLKQLPWMGQKTRQEALKKLSTFRTKIGYPDRWRDYTALNIGRDHFLNNVWAAESFEVQRDLAKIGQPLDRGEWYMSPPTVNAYYDPQSNEIVFPAGIMQPPFFSAHYDDAVNYGGLGTVIGHEITHGFDDQGRQYDEKGNLRNWWTPEDLANFSKLAKGVEEQFSGYKVADDLSINGKLVLGESIADLGGLKLSYLAYQRSLQGKKREVIDGFTPEQRFFLGYARIWAMNMRPEYERLQVNTDPHPHPRFRVNGPLSNMPEFSKAFHCPVNSPMVRSQMHQIW